MLRPTEEKDDLLATVVFDKPKLISAMQNENAADSKQETHITIHNGHTSRYQGKVANVPQACDRDSLPRRDLLHKPLWR
jgi:hypothetical protein